MTSQQQAIDILSSPRSLTLNLQRRVTMNEVFKLSVPHLMAKATIWKPKGRVGPGHLLQGEIALSTELLATFVFPSLRYEVQSINLFPRSRS